MSKPEVTYINIIKVDANKQAEIIKILQEGSDKFFSKQPGFISITLLASKDGEHVVNIAKWRSVDDITATRNSPLAAEFVKRTAEIAKATPGVYDIVGYYSS
ncbi:antibiotic biosynthesis monooxygenase [Xenorhabdus mauleonii]|uniref:Antibiotic biosynthesis monooxygenase n=1 Tax=Xenorhabdus mauleonii TaxID=351675 RepID=A0A1I3WZ14_9GAMM|nr:antibiotic biosynthesis monooxygenase family protein [Xenorhabdus mauleonii]PHM36633.1 antibiotic biosynthesis monooxygenase [Xenorhabdus mauleonii]SFK11876.1 Heme-degrading monooxygenase HmoA [Xenorhabdus mauleonii]